MASLFFPEKSSGNPALYSIGLVILAMSIWLSTAGSKVASLSLVISILGSGMGSEVGLGRVEMEMGRGSNTAGDSCHGRTFRFLQGLCILLSLVSLGELPILG